MTEVSYRLDTLLAKGKRQEDLLGLRGKYVNELMKLLWLADAFCKAWIACYCAGAYEPWLLIVILVPSCIVEFKHEAILCGLRALVECTQENARACKPSIFDVL